MVVDRKNQKAVVLLGLASGPLPNAVNLSVVANRVRSRTDYLRWGPRRQIRNFLPSTKKTTDYSFELFLFINKIVFDFCGLCENAGHHTVLGQKRGIWQRVIMCATSYWWSCGADGRTVNLVPRVLSLPPSRKYPGFGWSRVSLKQTAPHQGGLAFLQEAKRKANVNLFKLAQRQRNGSH